MAKTVIIIDDSKFLQKQISHFFEKNLGFHVIAIGNDGNEAVSLYRQYKPDLITLDIAMPNKDGQQAIKEIFTEFPDANVVMISAVKGDAMLDCMKMGAKGYIEKPLKFDNAEFAKDFQDTVGEVFSG
jgi:two-component system chemotaxis response regulator CheY